MKKRHLDVLLSKIVSFVFITDSPPLPPPPSGDMDDSRFSILPAPFDPRYSSNVSSSMDYGGNYTGDYNSRRSRLEDEDEDWIPENYLEKGVMTVGLFVSLNIVI